MFRSVIAKKEAKKKSNKEKTYGSAEKGDSSNIVGESSSCSNEELLRRSSLENSGTVVKWRERSDEAKRRTGKHLELRPLAQDLEIQKVRPKPRILHPALVDTQMLGFDGDYSGCGEQQSWPQSAHLPVPPVAPPPWPSGKYR